MKVNQELHKHLPRDYLSCFNLKRLEKKNCDLNLPSQTDKIHLFLCYQLLSHSFACRKGSVRNTLCPVCHVAFDIDYRKLHAHSSPNKF